MRTLDHPHKQLVTKTQLGSQFDDTSFLRTRTLSYQTDTKVEIKYKISSENAEIKPRTSFE